MKKVSILATIIIIMTFLLTGCNGDVTRDIRHAGFNLSTTTFTCSDLMPKKESDTNYKKIKYMNSNYAITEEGDIYDITLNQTYSDKTNCKKAKFDKKVVAIMDENIVKADDNKFYYTSTTSSSTPYTEVTVNDNSYEIYNLLLSNSDVVKVITVDQSNGIYYVLSTDGNVYKYVITRTDYNSPYQIASKERVYKISEYGKIIDFNYKGEKDTSTYIKTENEVYRIQNTNSESCTKYADVDCKYKMKKDETLSKYLNSKILYYGPSILITKYGKLFL